MPPERCSVLNKWNCSVIGNHSRNRMGLSLIQSGWLVFTVSLWSLRVYLYVCLALRMLYNMCLSYRLSLRNGLTIIKRYFWRRWTRWSRFTISQHYDLFISIFFFFFVLLPLVFLPLHVFSVIFALRVFFFLRFPLLCLCVPRSDFLQWSRVLYWLFYFHFINRSIGRNELATGRWIHRSRLDSSLVAVKYWTSYESND